MLEGVRMPTVPQVPFGSTGLMVSRLGLGAGSLGDSRLSDGDVERLLFGALDLGVTLIDAARSYGLAEERIGRILGEKRADVVLSTKVGYGIEGVADWTDACVTAGVDAALGRFRTDRLDIVHLHSCPLEVLTRGEVVEALQRTVAAGKVRVAAYSGENVELVWAVGSGAFGSVQASVNLCDRRSLSGPLAVAARAGLGVIAKRPLANAVWRHPYQPEAPDQAEYWRRWHALGLPLPGWDPAELALRFTAWAPGVSSAIVGTTSLEHLGHASTLVGRGPLPEDVLAELATRQRRSAAAWTGVI
jgi:aryl-alcohol dehydrogenase-like predicted oxidoreductase